jgi:gliding motility-associated lipoprotein GldH
MRRQTAAATITTAEITDHSGGGIVGELFKLKSLYCLLAALSFFACSGNEAYNQFRSIPDEAWEKDLPYDFEVTVTDTIDSYDVFLQVRNSNSYAYRNLWLFVQFATPDGQIRNDTINCELADAFGKWHGKGYHLFSLNLPYEQQIRFPASGVYSYAIRHGMRTDRLQGISDIGLRVVKHTNQ